MKKIFSLILLYSIALMTSCSSKTNDQSLRIGIMPSIDHLPLAYAQETGIFDSLGLKLELVPFQAPQEREAALQANQVDGAITDYTSAMTLDGNGTKIRLILRCDGRFYLAQRNPKADESQAPAIQESTVAISRNTVMEYALMVQLENLSMNSSECEMIDAQKIPLRVEMLRSGDVDWAMLPEPLASIALQNKAAHALMNVDVDVTGIAATTDALSKKREALSLMIKGYLLAVERLNATKDTEATKQFVSKTLKLPEGISLSLPTYRSDISIPLESLKQVRQYAHWLNVPENYQPDSLFVDLLKQD